MGKLTKINNFIDKFENYVIKLEFKNISISYKMPIWIIKEGNADFFAN